MYVILLLLFHYQSNIDYWTNRDETFLSCLIIRVVLFKIIIIPTDKYSNLFYLLIISTNRSI